MDLICSDRAQNGLALSGPIAGGTVSKRQRRVCRQSLDHARAIRSWCRWHRSPLVGLDELALPLFFLRQQSTSMLFSRLDAPAPAASTDDSTHSRRIHAFFATRRTGSSSCRVRSRPRAYSRPTTTPAPRREPQERRGGSVESAREKLAARARDDENASFSFFTVFLLKRKRRGSIRNHRTRTERQRSNKVTRHNSPI